MSNTGSVIISWDFSHGKDVGVLIVGQKQNGHMEIVNAFLGKEAEELCKKLMIKEEKKNGER